MPHEKLQIPFVLLSILVACSVQASEEIPAPVKSKSWTYLNGVHGRGYAICDAIHGRLNSYKWTDESVNEGLGFYVQAAVTSYSGWKDPPWQNLHPKEHEELVRKLLKYQALGADVYFGRKKVRQGKDYLSSLERSIDSALKKDIRLRIWRTHLINWLDGKSAPLGDQTVVEIAFLKSAAEMDELRRAQPDKPEGRYMGTVFLVTDDLHGPDPRVSDWDARRIASVLLFNGKPHFGGAASTGRVVSLYRDFGSGPASFCELQYGF